MLTPTSSSTSISSRTVSLQSMLLELDRKISEISELKGQITERMHSQEIQQSAKKQSFNKDKQKEQQIYAKIKYFGEFFKNQYAVQIQTSLQSYSKHSMQYTMSIINFYEKEIKKCRGYYQSQIWDLRQEIKRQYKVIAMMKQEVEDLMVLIKYKQTDGQDQDIEDDESAYNSNQHQKQSDKNNQSQAKHNKDNNDLRINLPNNRTYQGQLDVIEEETERTLQSSQRSQGTQNQTIQTKTNFIKIQQKQQIDKTAKKEDRLQKSEKLQKQREQFEQDYSKYNKQRKQAVQIDAYQQFCESLTPKQSERKVQQLHLNEKKRIYNFQSQQYQHIPKQEKEQINFKTQTQQNNKQDLRFNKMHTAPSDDRKNDHLQSIFFLDEQPEYLNRTTKLQCYDKSKNVDLRMEQKNYEAIQLSQVSYSGEDDYSLQEEGYEKSLTNNNKKKTDVPILHTQKLTQYASQKLYQYNQEYSCQSKIMTQSQSQYLYEQKKHVKNTRTLTQQQTNEYIFKKFNKAIPLTQFKNSSSMPVHLNNQPLGELSPNIDCERMSSRNSIQNKPKTKQFLQEFRRTFNKCLNSMQVSKKNSTKIATSSNSSSNSKHHQKNNTNLMNQSDSNSNIASGVMTFGKGYSGSSSHSSLSHKDSESIAHKENKGLDLDGKQIKAVDHMLKELENNNKFIIGGKKLQLKYEGQKKNGTRNGNGTLYYSNGLCYQGQFKEGLRHGYGVLRFNNIQIYNGDWVNDQINGQGKIRNCAIINKRKTIYSNQSPLGKWISYTGQFKNSKFEGSGTLYLQGGQKFVGSFSQGHANGEGSIYRKNGEVENGIWHNNILVDRQLQKQ